MAADSPLLEELTWGDVRDEVDQLNPEFAALLMRLARMMSIICIE